MAGPRVDGASSSSRLLSIASPARKVPLEATNLMAGAGAGSIYSSVRAGTINTVATKHAAHNGVMAKANSNPDSDFFTRCAAPGVVLCRGLDTEVELQAGEIGNSADGSRQGFIDASTKSSGGGSLRFRLRSGVSAKNIGGYWETPLGATFSVGDTIYVQYRFLATPEYFSNNANYWQSSIKHINIHGPTSTCQGAEFTTVLEPGKQLSMYTNCGHGWHTDLNTNKLLSTCKGDCLIQQGSTTASSPSGNGYNCRYQNQFSGKGDGSGCFWPAAGIWYTIYEKIFIGQFGGSTTTVDAYVSVDGAEYKQFHRVTGVYFNNNRDSNFSKLRFETYMSEIKRAAPFDAFIWYDELIVSRQPIAAPRG